MKLGGTEQLSAEQIKELSTPYTKHVKERFGEASKISEDALKRISLAHKFIAELRG